MYSSRSLICVFLLVGLGSSGRASAAECETAVSPAEIRTTADVAQRAFGELDPATFGAAREQVESGLPCVSTPMPPPVAARVHLLSALAAFLDDDQAQTVASFQAARAAHPSLELGAWLPDTHPLRLDWRIAGILDEPEPSALTLFGEDQLLVDGLEGETLVLTRPAVLQRVQSGSVVDTSLWQGGELPGWMELYEPRLGPEIKRRLWLGGATFVVAGATGALLAVSSTAHDRYVDEDTPYEDLATLEKRANATSSAAIGTGAVALGLGVGLAVTW